DRGQARRDCHAGRRTAGLRRGARPPGRPLRQEGTRMTSRRGTLRLILSLARPYKAALVTVLAAMSVETIASLAAPWPLKIVIDSVSAAHRPADWAWLSTVAAAGVVAVALVDGVASYIDSYYTEIVGQHVANDLRMRLYDHLECLSFGYYDAHETGAL